MEPELQPLAEQRTSATPESQTAAVPQKANEWIEGRERDWFDWFFVGPHGLRAGWSILLFYGLYYLFRLVIGTFFYAFGLIGDSVEFSALSVVFNELVPFLSLLASMGIMAIIEGRRITDYNLARTNRMRRFAGGLAAGFGAISLLVAILVLGGWMSIGPAAPHLGRILLQAALWGCAFLLVGSVEEGIMRCYALFTLARGINFWWALVAEAVLCGYTYRYVHGNCAVGVYLVACAGLVPCFVVHLRFPAQSAFWQGAWVTSTVFGLYHTANNGENWIGIFAAGLIGLVFCASVRLTGSAWWAIGCHAAWDWAETFFYGTADSGIQGQGHFLSAYPTGNPLWSGGTDGPEGSLLVFGVILALLLFLRAVFGRRKIQLPAPEPSQYSAR